MGHGKAELGKFLVHLNWKFNSFRQQSGTLSDKVYRNSTHRTEISVTIWNRKWLYWISGHDLSKMK